MGEIAEMMLGGEMCPCGEYLGGGDGIGFPQYCSKQCERDYGGAPLKAATVKNSRTHPCLKCGRSLRGEAGLAQHMKDKHGAAS